MTMEIEDLYITSDRLVAGVSMTFKRDLYSTIDWNSRMVCIKGARGVGKTTMLKQYMKDHFMGDHRALYVSLDDFFFTDHHIIDVAEYHYLHGGDWLFVDEVHHYPFENLWARELKNIYDRYPAMHIVFTGSSMLLIEKASADLSRRCTFYDLGGLTFREYLDYKHILSYPSLTLEEILTNHVERALDITSKVKVIPLFIDYLDHGYYPFYEETKNSYGKMLQQIATNVLEVDVPAVEKVEYTTIQKMRRLLAFIAQTVPFTVNISNIATTIGVPRQSVTKLLHLLQRAALINMLYNGKETINQLAKPEKVYLENTNLMYALSPKADIGTIRETFFCNQMLAAHHVAFTGVGDFLVDDQFTFEVGGRNKKFKQIKDVPESFIAMDDIETGAGYKIPLWLFGMM